MGFYLNKDFYKVEIGCLIMVSPVFTFYISILWVCLVSSSPLGYNKRARSEELDVEADDEYFNRPENRNLLRSLFNSPGMYEAPKGGKPFEVVGLPNHFKKYDLNRDGYISMVELADITDTVLEDNEKPFKKADKNGDGLLTKYELQRAPWVFDKTIKNRSRRRRGASTRHNNA